MPNNSILVKGLQKFCKDLHVLKDVDAERHACRPPRRTPGGGGGAFEAAGTSLSA